MSEPETCQKLDAKQGEEALEERMNRIKHKIIVMSGKGGVGKSTVSVNLAAALAEMGLKAGLLDVDIHGPSVPKMLQLEDQGIHGDEGDLIPLEPTPNLKVMSIGLLLREPREAMICRGPMKTNIIRQFLRDVSWGDLDCLVVDCPPGTGDEPMSVVQLIGHVDGAVIVTTPQDLAIIDVRRSVIFCNRLQVEILGIVENMSGYTCPHCGELLDLFGSGGGLILAQDIKAPLLGAIPFDNQIVQSGDTGVPFVLADPESETTKIMNRAAQTVCKALQMKQRAA